MEKKKRGRPSKKPLNEYDLLNKSTSLITPLTEPPKEEPDYYEKSRTYFFPISNEVTRDISIVPIEIKGIKDVEVHTTGSHKITTKDGYFIIPKKWISIFIEK